MSKFSKTWWGKRFIEALESFTDSGRLSRGRSYARNGKIKSHHITKGIITAQVRGSVNPYFGVYTEPLYDTEISLTPISSKNWQKAIAFLSSKASCVSKLLMNEMPDNIDEILAESGLHLLPHNSKDFHTDCSCPDWSNPCKHIAGVCYLVASELDNDPFLLFELRGLSRDKLQKELIKSPLGQIISQGLTTEELVPEIVESYYPQPTLSTYKKAKINPQEFWRGEKPIPENFPSTSPTTIPAITIKKAGDYPPFWHEERSFIEVMSEFYDRIRSKNQSNL